MQQSSPMKFVSARFWIRICLSHVGMVLLDMQKFPSMRCACYGHARWFLAVNIYNPSSFLEPIFTLSNFFCNYSNLCPKTNSPLTKEHEIHSSPRPPPAGFGHANHPQRRQHRNHSATVLRRYSQRRRKFHLRGPGRRSRKRVPTLRLHLSQRRKPSSP